MSDVLFLFELTTDTVRDNLYQKIQVWLSEQEASESATARLNYLQPPFDSSQETHQFAWLESQTGWMDILRSGDKIVQLVLNLRYPKRRWFSRHKKDLAKVQQIAESLFGDAQVMNLGDTQTALFGNHQLKVLLKSYQRGRHAFIELKVARGAFCS